MTDYTQMTDQELADAAAEIDAVNAEQYRRQWIQYAPVNLFSILLQAPTRGADRVEILLAGMNMTLNMFEPGGEPDPERDIPVIDDTMAQEVIDALQARLAQ